MNKGVGRSVEFRGLTSQYLFLFAAGMLASLLLTMVLYMAGADRTLCILVALVCMSLVIWGTFRMNRCYGPHGLMKRLAARRHGCPGGLAPAPSARSRDAASRLPHDQSR